jgi:hypothetical protein
MPLAKIEHLFELGGIVFENYRISKTSKGYCLMYENSRDIWKGGSLNVP